MQYAALKIKTIVLHEVVKKSGGAGKPILSEVASHMDAGQTAYIQERIRAALGGHARPIVEDEGVSTVPNEIRQYLAAGKDLLAVSGELVQALQVAQPGVSPGGIFVAAEVELGSDPGLLLAKLEHERGVRAEQTTLPDGRTTFTVQLLKDLLFTTGSRVFKVALFTKSGLQTAEVDGSGEEDDSPVEVLSGVVVDQQVSGSTIAHFFLSAFLGCRFAEQSDILTERFYTSAGTWINALNDDEKKGRYQLALMGELQSNRPTLSVNKFAAENLSVEDRDEFVASMQGSSVPMRTFDKDIELVRAKLSRLRIDTESGVMLLAPPESVSEGVVTIENHPGQLTTVTVRDKLTKLSGQGRVAAEKAPADGS
jgi:hypothetical protein